MVFAIHDDFAVTLTWLDRQGRVVGTASEPADWGITSISLQGDKAVLTRADPDRGDIDLWLVDLVRGVGSPIRNEGDQNHPVFSPDGDAVVFVSTLSGPTGLYLQKLGGRPEHLISGAQVRAFDWTKDGYIIYSDRTAETGGDIWFLPIFEKGPPRPFLRTADYEGDAAVSPDGRWIAYMSNSSGREEVYVQPFPAGGVPYRVSFNGGVRPKWSADGRELFFMTPNTEIASSRIKHADSRFECTVPTILFRIPGLVPPQPSFRTAYAVAPDGRFLVVVTRNDNIPPPINVTVKWRKERGR